MKLFSKRMLAIAVGLTLPTAAFATNGMFMIGFGAKSIGMGGAGVAYAQDGLSSATNPANLALIGNRFDLDVGLFSARASASLGGIHAKSVIGLGGDERTPRWDDVYLMPDIAWAKQNGSWAYGFNFVPVGGGGSAYKKNFFDLNQNPSHTPTGGTDTGTLGISLFVAQFNPTIAYAFSKKNTLGASLVVGMQRFVAFGLGNFTTFTASGNAAHLTNNGEDWSTGLGARLGWTGKFLDDDRLTLGASATSKIDMSRFHEYSELFAGNGKIDTPANWIIGAAYKVTRNATVAFDIERYLYSGVNSISNAGPNTSGGLYPVSKSVNALGLAQGLGFGWSDQTVYKLGLNYDWSDKLALRGGWNFGKSPVNAAQDIAFNILAPAVTQKHLTLGGTYKESSNLEWNLAYMHAFTFKEYGPTYLGGTGSIQMQQDSLDVSVGYKF
ncbi:MAG: OmpP1/FadL family transporter [Acidiferrobacterales bacterium]